MSHKSSTPPSMTWTVQLVGHEIHLIVRDDTHVLTIPFEKADAVRLGLGLRAAAAELTMYEIEAEREEQYDANRPPRRVRQLMADIFGKTYRRRKPKTVADFVE